MLLELSKIAYEFKQVFRFDDVGHLIVVPEKMIQFCNPHNRFYLSLIGSVEIPELQFSGDEKKVRIQAIQIYGLCYAALLKFASIAKEHQI
tara:strand:+ start:168 stop:440 length:273 start_codon:yes stop_codon:yes gene_type:complete